MSRSPAKMLWAVITCAAVLLCVAGASWSQTAPSVSMLPDNRSAQAPVTPPVQPPVTGQTSAAIQAPDYMIGVDDILDFYIVDVPELSRQYRVSGNGMVTFPMLQTPVTAAGLTLSQFSEQLTKDLKTAGLVSGPHFNTLLKHSR